MKIFPHLRNQCVAGDHSASTALKLLAAFIAAATLLCVQPVLAQDTLEKYYLNYCTDLPLTVFDTSVCRRYRYTGGIPRDPLPIIARELELPNGPVGAKRTAGSHRVAFFRLLPSPEPALPILYVYAGIGFAQCGNIVLPKPFVAGSVTTQDVVVEFGGPGCEPFTNENIDHSRVYTDRYAFGAPIRRKAFDGGIFEASPMVQTRNGQPWITAYWGLNLGLVESRFDRDPVALALLPAFGNEFGFWGKEYESVLLTLPPPIIEGEITEYQNTLDFPNAPGGVYFYAANDADRAVLDSGAPGKWSRTGSKFNSGGYVSVCRFYGSVSPGPNSHFYTADDKECDVLKALQITPTPLSRQQLNFEGKTFSASVPTPAAVAGSSPVCPVKSIALYRAYNAAYTAAGKQNYDSNHRFTTSRADINEVVAKGWVDEGVVMCVPE